MPFVKLDCGILNSTIWFERDAREVFITALLMAEPLELREPAPQINVRDLEPTGWTVPPGWYGFVPAAGVGIINRAGLEREAGLTALEQLGAPEIESRSPEFDGRRLVRIDGGYIVLNYIKYREKDATTAERSRRWRQRKKEQETQTTDTAQRVSETPSRVIRHQAEAEVQVQADPERSKPSSESKSDSDFEAFRSAYPKNRRQGGKRTKAAFREARKTTSLEAMLAALEQHKRSEQWQDPKLIPLMTTWLHQERWTQELPSAQKHQRAVDAPTSWKCQLHDPPCATTDAHCTLMAQEHGGVWRFNSTKQFCEKHQH